jgi:hypothetical protein
MNSNSQTTVQTSWIADAGALTAAFLLSAYFIRCRPRSEEPKTGGRQVHQEEGDLLPGDSEPVHPCPGVH